MREERNYQKLELREYQKKFILDDNHIVMGNISRNGGKTFLLMLKVLHDRPRKVLFIDDNANKFKSFGEKLKEILSMEDEIKNKIEYLSIKQNLITIRYKDGDQTEIFNYKNEEFKHITYCDMALFNDCLPQLDIKADKYIATFSIPYPIMNIFPNRKDIGYHTVGIKELCDSQIFNIDLVDRMKKDIDNDYMFYREIDIFNEYKDINNNIDEDLFNKKDIIRQQIQKLYEEFSSIDKTEKTTIRREKVLQQIIMLEKLQEEKYN